jgi:Cu/Ag efflux protein CusF
MSGMAHGSRDHESMPGMSHDSMSGMVHGSMDRESMPGMSGSQRQMLPAHDSKPGMDHAKHKMQMAHSGHGHVQGTGTVNSVDATAHKLNVSHGPIPTIGLPAMTMDFSVGSSVDLSAVKPGTRIKFEMEQAQDGSYVIQSIAPAGGRQ